MPVIRCTTKLRKVGRWPVVEPPDSGGSDNEWYANLLWFDRRKCVHFVHGATLYGFLMLDVVKKDLDDMGELLRTGLYDQLLYDGIDLNDAVPILRTEGPAEIAVARDRSILGSMRELAYGYEWTVARAGGPKFASRRAVARGANFTPMTRLKYADPQDAMREYVGYPPLTHAERTAMDGW